MAQQATLLFLIDRTNQKICLGMKKRGFGAGKWNGFGGKVNGEESIIDTAIRELFEETSSEDGKPGTKIDQTDINHVATINFMFTHKPGWIQEVHVFITENWTGEPYESEEMRPRWFSFNEIPYSEMWPDDELWLPRVIAGERLEGSVTIDDKDGIVEQSFTSI